MNKLTSVVVATVAATVVLAPVATATAAPARHWTTVESGFKARQQACKVPVNGGTAWKIYNRLNSSKVTGGRLAATLTATNQGKPVADRSWTSGWVKKGHISAVGTFRIPRKAGWALQMSLHGDNAGSGGVLTVADIGRC